MEIKSKYAFLRVKNNIIDLSILNNYEVFNIYDEYNDGFIYDCLVKDFNMTVENNIVYITYKKPDFKVLGKAKPYDEVIQNLDEGVIKYLNSEYNSICGGVGYEDIRYFEDMKVCDSKEKGLFWFRYGNVKKFVHPPYLDYSCFLKDSVGKNVERIYINMAINIRVEELILEDK